MNIGAIIAATVLVAAVGLFIGVFLGVWELEFVSEGSFIFYIVAFDCVICDKECI